ncbi:ribonuclease P protein component [Spiribacter insolitus]|uniref:Ribonuclease P protein component n=1 Tax=Spiribacter insolitus TaxID=3122417 RepID=A0ABV3T8G8_9GAMM
MVEAAASGHGFPRAARLTRSAEFRAVFGDAQRHADRYFTILAGHGSVSHARLGLAVSRRAASRAVDRNRLKRLIRETFRQQLPGLPAVDVVVMVRPIACHTENAKLAAALDRLWQRISRSCEAS